MSKSIRQQLRQAKFKEYERDWLDSSRHGTVKDVTLVAPRNGRRCKNCRAWGPLANADGSPHSPRNRNACKLVARDENGRVVASKQFGARTKPGMCCEHFIPKGKPKINLKPLLNIDSA